MFIERLKDDFVEKFISKVGRLLFNDDFEIKLIYKNSFIEAMYIYKNDSYFIKLDDFDASISKNFNCLYISQNELRVIWRRTLNKNFGDEYSKAFYNDRRLKILEENENQLNSLKHEMEELLFENDQVL